MAKGRFGEAGLPPSAQGAIGGCFTCSGPGATLLAVRSIGLCLTALPLLLALPSAAWAQEQAPASEPTSEPASEPVISFSADEVVYIFDTDVVTAQGQVRMDRD